MSYKLQSDERGIAHLAAIVAVVVVLAVAGVGYVVFSKNKDKTATVNDSASSKAITAECTKEIDDKDFCKFVSNWTYGKEQKMVMTSGDGTKVTTETDANGNTSVVSEKNGTVESAFISIGKSTYVKNVSSGNWTKYTQEPTDTTPEVSDGMVEDYNFEEEAKKDTSKVTSLGKEACGNLSCFKYELTDTTTPNDKTIIWFDDKDYKLRRMVITSEGGSTDIAVSYDVASITEPSPVVEAPNYENMSAEELQKLMEQYGQ